ncbi:MAG: ATP-binding protein [Defluviitaleaceae bacterium]|nr:ATP-binding protein [Defluviitaleaceae bacterium]MCL2273976.1 ATP-binding protein [Defluviitaleaceae bacterium]
MSFNNVKVKTKILLVLIIIISVVTAVVVSIRANQVRVQTDMLLEERLKGNANMAFGIFDTVRVYTLWMLDTASNYVRQDYTGTGMDIHLANMWRSMNHSNNGLYLYENIAVFDADLNLISAANPYRAVPNIHTFPQYHNEMMAGYWISPVYISAEGHLQFLFTQPVYDNGTLLGMVAITSNTQMMAYFLRDFIQLYDSFVNIADRSGVIFFSTRPEAYMGRRVDELGVIETFGDIPWNTLFAHTSSLTGIDKIAYVVYDPYLQWSIISFFDADAVESAARAIFTSLLPTLAGVLLATVLILIIIHAAFKPLQKLADKADEIAKGNVDVVFEVKNNDEISQVGVAFMEIVRMLNILRSNFEKAENAITHGEIIYTIEDTRLGGVYDEILARTSNIIGHIKQAMLQAKAANKAKSDFLSKMSHEIRTPMNAITGMAALMMRENLTPAVREQSLIIKQSGDHLLSIINDILDLSKVESGKLEINEATYLFHSTMHDVISIIKMRMADTKDINFAVYMQHDIPNELIGDEVRVRQVLINILTNALKYTRSGHFTLEIFGKKQDDGTIHLTFKVKDMGIGIKPEDMKKLFGEFEQFDHELNRNIEGTGLGLAITQNLITLMGGTIEVQSTYGEGSEFIVYLPQKIYENAEGADAAGYGAWPPQFTSESALLYCKTPLYEQYIARALHDLKINYEVIKDERDLEYALTTSTWGYVFAEAELAMQAQHIVVATLNDAKIIMFGGEGDTSITVLDTPVYLMSIVSILYGRDEALLPHKCPTEPFIAPNARVLIVDDIKTNLKVGQGLLKPFKMQVDLCDSGKSAIEAVCNFDYDLIFMDHMMPEMDGVEAVKIIRGLGEKHAKMPIVALTANAIVGAREMFLQNGFDDFLSKPIEIAKLGSMLSKWIPKEKQEVEINDEEVIREIFDTPEINIDGVNTALGITRAGGDIDSYLEILSVFYEDGTKKITDLAECVQRNDLSLYTTYVHAIKSAAANIGAISLSEDAKKLEAAGREGNAQFIALNNAALENKLKILLNNINNIVADKKETAPEEILLDTAELQFILDKFKIALMGFNVSLIDEINLELNPYTRHPTLGAQIKEILQLAFVGKYKQALEEINKVDL